jgi:hypothetical protein
VEEKEKTEEEKIDDRITLEVMKEIMELACLKFQWS